MWREETANRNLLPSLEGALQISLLCEYIKEYGIHGRLYHKVFYTILSKLFWCTDTPGMRQSDMLVSERHSRAPKVWQVGSVVL